MATTISAIPASVVISRIGYVHYKKLIREKRIELVRTARFPYEALVKTPLFFSRFWIWIKNVLLVAMQETEIME